MCLFYNFFNIKNCKYITIVLPYGQWRPPGAMRGRGAVLPPAALTAFVCKRLRLYRPSGGKCRLWRLCSALTGAMEREGLSYRQLRLMTASCAHYVRLQAVTNVLPFGQWRPNGRYERGAVLPPAMLADTRLQAVTIVSPFGREMPPAAAIWRAPRAIIGGELLSAICAR